MDAIDITNADFFLGNTPTNLNIPENISENILEKLNIPIYVWIGLFIIICIVLGFIYNNNMKKNKVTFQDNLDNCYGDTCPI
jgi:preprotein translocase subunit SecG